MIKSFFPSLFLLLLLCTSTAAWAQRVEEPGGCSYESGNTRDEAQPQENTDNTGHKLKISDDGRVHCDLCRGTGKIVCPHCGGKGLHERCIFCLGMGKVSIGYTCVTCGGDGIMDCLVCHNKGIAKCPQCGGKGWYYIITGSAQEETSRPKPDVGVNDRQRKPTNRRSNQRSLYPACGGLGISNLDDTAIPDSIAHSNYKFINQEGLQCPFCGSQSRHVHFRCETCHGTGH